MTNHHKEQPQRKWEREAANKETAFSGLHQGSVQKLKRAVSSTIPVTFSKVSERMPKDLEKLQKPACFHFQQGRCPNSGCDHCHAPVWTQHSKQSAHKTEPILDANGKTSASFFYCGHIVVFPVFTHRLPVRSFH